MRSMVPVPATLPDRAHDVGTQVQAALKTFGTHWRAVFAPALAVQVCALLPYLATPKRAPSDPASMADWLAWIQSPASWALLAMVALAQLYLSCVLLYRLGCRGRGLDPGLNASLARALDRVFAAAGGMLVYVLVLVLGFLPSIMLTGLAAQPGRGGADSALLSLLALVSVSLPLWWSVAAGLTLPAVVLERRGPLDSIRRSLTLVRGHWWSVSVVLGVVLLIQLAVSMALALLIAVVTQVARVAASLPPEPGDGWGLALQLVLSPVNAVLLILLFSGLIAVFNERVVSTTAAPNPV